ncbi:MAG: hypothetical protein KJ905_04160 [Nanoarchaeota archaeon]|nr:hypothetical protein [Nanoarchaeota archaeon]MBU1501933.1 hypothetical protein [Nanoarchaeota archaeon]
MTTIDEEIDQMVKECPILLDEDFQRQHPGIIEVAGFLDVVAKEERRDIGSYKLFDDLGIETIGEYLALISSGNLKARKVYEKVRDICRFE